MIVTVQGSNVRSPATGRTRPLYGTGILPKFEAGISAALQRKFTFSSLTLSGPTDAGKVISTSNKLDLAPPPVSLPLRR